MRKRRQYRQLPGMLLGLVFFAGLAGWAGDHDFTVTDGDGNALVVFRGDGDIFLLKGELHQEAGEGELADHPDVDEFLVEFENGNVARVDGGTGDLYIKGEAIRDPYLRRRSGIAELVLEDNDGFAKAIIDEQGNLRYRGLLGVVMERTTPLQYSPGGVVDVEVTLRYHDTEDISALGVRESIPDGWTFHSLTPGAGNPSVSPSEEDTGQLEFAWTSIPDFPISFTYRLNVPGGSCGDKTITGKCVYRAVYGEQTSNTVVTMLAQGDAEGEGLLGGQDEGEESVPTTESDAAAPSPGGPLRGGEGEGEGEGTEGGKNECEGEDVLEPENDPEYHTADQDQDEYIGLSELLRIIQFYNSGSFHCEECTEDGYAPGSGSHECTYHDGDYRIGSDPGYPGHDWIISLSELLRIIQFYNPGLYGVSGYSPLWCTEDGFSHGTHVRNFEMDCPGVDFLGFTYSCFEHVRIGDADGFGWGDGSQLTAYGIRSPHLPPECGGVEGEYIPVNVDGTDILGPGDFLPDMNYDRMVCFLRQDVQPEEYPGDDWDNRSENEQQGHAWQCGNCSGSHYPYVSGSDYTDISLSTSYDNSRVIVMGEGRRCSYKTDEGDLIEPGSSGGQLPEGEEHFPVDLGPFPEASLDSCDPTDNNARFWFDFYVPEHAIDHNAPLYLNVVFADFDVGEARLELNTRATEATPANDSFVVRLQKHLEGYDGLIQGTFVELNGETYQAGEGLQAVTYTTPTFCDVFTLEPGLFSWHWHGYLSVTFVQPENSYPEPYLAFDFIEIAQDLSSIHAVRVPYDYDTIAEAVAASGSGDTIVVAPGTYHERLVIDKDIVLRSEHPERRETVDATIIDGDAEGPVIRFTGARSAACATMGLTLKNGRAKLAQEEAGNGGGICGGANCYAQIRYNVICENVAERDGGGIYACQGRIVENGIRNNTAGRHGGGIAEGGEVVQNIIRYNEAGLSETETGHGGGVYKCSKLDGNIIHHNQCDGAGIGVYIDRGTDTALPVVNNVVYQNSRSTTIDTWGCGLHVVPLNNANEHVYVLHNTFNANTGGPTIHAGEDVTCVNCVLYGNSDGDYEPGEGPLPEGFSPHFCCIFGGPAEQYDEDHNWSTWYAHFVSTTDPADYHIQANSQLRDRFGYFFFPYALPISQFAPKDMDGDSRIVLGCDSGELRFDVGADEYCEGNP